MLQCTHHIILRIAMVFHCPDCGAGSMCLWVQACGGQRDHWVPWSCWQCEQPSVDAGNPTQALWKSSKCFGLLSHLSSLRNKFKRKQLKVVLNPYTPCYAQQMFPINTDFCWNVYSLICVHLSHLLTIQTAHLIIFMEKCQLHYWYYIVAFLFLSFFERRCIYFKKGSIFLFHTLRLFCLLQISTVLSCCLGGCWQPLMQILWDLLYFVLLVYLIDSGFPK